MKKLVIILIAGLFAVSTQAQTQQATPASQTAPAPAKQQQAAPAKSATTADHGMKDCIGMKDGKMWMRKDGKTTPMEKDVTMKDGMKITTDGHYTMKDGKTGVLKNGECIDKDGKIMKSDAEKKAEKKDDKANPAPPMNK